MKIGLIVEGLAEPQAFQSLLPRIATTHEILHRPLRADMQPRSNALVIAKSAESQVNLLRARAVDLVVVLIDTEGHGCPPEFASSIRVAFTALYGAPQFEVVAKHQCLENWLIADPVALKEQRGRFDGIEIVERVARTGNADSANAQNLLASVCKGPNYQKGADPQKILARQSPERAAMCSRSYRRFLRVLGHPDYLDQSKRPAR